MNSEYLDIYTERLLAHINAVREAGRKIGVPIKQLGQHDVSKWDENEFIAYAKHFCGGGAPDFFARAWLHHIHHNPHHWNHWLFSDNYNIEGGEIVGGAIEMPRHYALEMVADWMGASFVYSGSWDMADWLAKNISKVKVHPRTAIYLDGVLDSLGYADVIYSVDWALGRV